MPIPAFGNGKTPIHSTRKAVEPAVAPVALATRVKVLCSALASKKSPATISEASSMQSAVITIWSPYTGIKALKVRF